MSVSMPKRARALIVPLPLKNQSSRKTRGHHHVFLPAIPSESQHIFLYIYSLSSEEVIWKGGANGTTSLY